MTIGLVVLAVAVVALIVAIAVVASSDGGDTPTTTTTTTVAPTTTTTASPDPQGFAVALYNAWRAGDRTAASHVASPDALNQMFAVPPTNSAVDPYSFEGCQGAAGSTICTWQASGMSTITMRVRNTTGGLPVLVVEVKRTP